MPLLAPSLDYTDRDFDALRARMESADDLTRDELATRCRKLLGGPLAGTDEAWDELSAEDDGHLWHEAAPQAGGAGAVAGPRETG